MASVDRATAWTNRRIWQPLAKLRGRITDAEKHPRFSRAVSALGRTSPLVGGIALAGMDRCAAGIADHPWTAALALGLGALGTWRVRVRLNRRMDGAISSEGKMAEDLVQIDQLRKKAESKAVKLQKRVNNLTRGFVGGRYLLKQKIGEGGMGEIWRVVDSEENEVRALKLFIPGKEQPAAIHGFLRERFMNEAALLQEIDHPNIIKVYDSGIDEKSDNPWYVMELLKGAPLAKVRKRMNAGRFSQLEAAGIIRQIFQALQTAHEAGVVHRDVNPNNVMLVEGADGAAICKLIDFGVAQDQVRAGDFTKTAVGQAMGTPTYMAPEQTEEAPRPITWKIDILALGFVYHELLTGIPPALVGERLDKTNLVFPEQLKIDPLTRKLIESMTDPRPTHRLALFHPSNALEGLVELYSQWQTRYNQVNDPDRDRELGNLKKGIVQREDIMRGIIYPKLEKILDEIFARAEKQGG